MKLYEATFTFTPASDEAAGEGYVTIQAETVEQAAEAVTDFLSDVPDLQLVEIKEVVELPDTVDFTPRTLN